MLDAREFAKTIPGFIKLDSGINWQWAEFNNIMDAQLFNSMIVENGWETRGVYDPKRYNRESNVCVVSFR